MFVVHTIYENEGNTTRDYGHVNQFFRCNPEFRAQKDERIFKKCVEQGFIYVKHWMQGNKVRITYHKSLTELNDELIYNRAVNQTLKDEQ